MDGEFFLFHCFLCGIRFYPLHIVADDGLEPWLYELRAVYHDGTGAHVTGVRRYIHGEEDMFPVNPSMTWRDDEASSGLIEIHPAADPLMTLGYGFYIHDSCWKLMQKASMPVGVPLERLWRVCDSLPVPYSAARLIWGHDYGGIIDHVIDGPCPWGEYFQEVDIPDIEAKGALNDPFSELDIHTMLQRNGDPPDLLERPSTDALSKLPMELREMIAVNLSSHDFFNLRMASRSFYAIFLSTAFWWSRFLPDSERGFLFEIMEDPRAREISKLLCLYRVSGRPVAKPEIFNRARVWKLARWLLPIVSAAPPSEDLHDSTRILPACSHWVYIHRQEFHELDFDSSHQDMDDRYEYLALCGSTTTIYVPTEGVIKLGVFLITTGLWDCVTGIRLLYQNGDRKTIDHAYGEENVLSVTELQRFRVAMAPSGVRALQVIDQGQEVSHWVGCATGAPQSDRLVLGSSVKGLRVTFDAYKIAGLGVCGSQFDNAFNRSRSKDLRLTALWYPEIPPADVCLNCETFTGKDPIFDTYRPLRWVRFGGSGGKHLGRVKGIITRYSGIRPKGILSLRFVYDETNHDEYSNGLANEDAYSRHDEFFSIDGAGGERIDRIAMVADPDPDAYDDYPLHQHGILQRIKIGTSRNRTKSIGKAKKRSTIRPLEIVPGTAITGFYGHYDNNFGLATLGVISERITDSEAEATGTE